MTVSRSRTSASRTKAAERRLRCLELRRSGQTLEAIGAELGITRQAVHKHLTTAIASLRVQTAGEAADLKVQHADRLDRLLVAVWDKATAGDLRAIDTALRVLDRIARLHGVDAPFKVAPTDPDGDEPFAPPPGSVDGALAEVLALLDGTRTREGASVTGPSSQPDPG